MSVSSVEPIPISLVVHTVFCARRAWLEAAGETVESYNIEVGLRTHERVDSEKGGLNPTSVVLGDTELGVVGRADLVQSAGDPGATLVEYKATPGKRKPRVSRANEIQLALQRMCLERQGVTVSAQQVYFPNHRRSVDVELTETDFVAATDYVAQTRRVIEAHEAPQPLFNDPRCDHCSHAGVCLPDEYQLKQVQRVRSSVPAGEVLHLTTPGSRASLSGGRVIVSDRASEHSVPIDRVGGLVINGNVDVSSALIRELLWRGLSVVWCSGRGRVIGFARSAASPNGLARLKQHSLLSRSQPYLAVEMIAPKIANQATFLRRNAKWRDPDSIATLRDAARRASEATSNVDLLAIEGGAASIYFGRFGNMLNEQGSWILDYWPGRVGRGAVDPLNVALNYLYGLLLGEVIRGIHSCGLDPHIGVVHSSNRNKPALALDLMEQFRPLVADSAVLTAVNNGELKNSDFSLVLGGARLRDRARKVLTKAFSRRVQQPFTHPTYQYEITWQRAMEVQSRMLLSHLQDEGGRYVGIRTR